MGKKILGLDIRFHEVTALLVDRGIKNDSVRDCIRVPIADTEAREESLHRTVEQIAEQMDIVDAQCIASISAEQISFRTLHLPFKDPKKIRQVLPFELEPVMSMPIDDAMIDFRQTRLPGNGNDTHLIAATVEKSYLAAITSALDEFNIIPDVITVSGYPLAIYLAQKIYGPEPFLIADIDQRTCTLFFISARNVCFIRSFQTAVDSDGIAPLCAQIRHTMSAFEDLFHIDFKPVRIVIVGDGTASKGAAIENNLGFPAAAATLSPDATNRTTRDSDSDRLLAHADNAYALTLVETLGFKVFNFSKGGFARPSKWMDYKKQFIAPGILMLLVGLLFMINLMIETSSLENKVSRLDSQVTDIFKASFPEVNRIVDPVHQMKMKIDEAMNNRFIDDVPEVKIRKIDILNEISQRIPKEIDVEFNKLAMGPEGVTISGQTDTFNSVDEMKNRLEEAAIFKKVTISSANINRSSSHVVFKLRAQI